jgi:hypothetical protein
MYFCNSINTRSVSGLSVIRAGCCAERVSAGGIMEGAPPTDGHTWLNCWMSLFYFAPLLAFSLPHHPLSSAGRRHLSAGLLIKSFTLGRPFWLHSSTHKTFKVRPSWREALDGLMHLFPACVCAPYLDERAPRDRREQETPSEREINNDGLLGVQEKIMNYSKAHDIETWLVVF